jgi:hypothetical protein
LSFLNRGKVQITVYYLMSFIEYKNIVIIHIFLIVVFILIYGEIQAAYLEMTPSLGWQIYYEDNIAGVPQKSAIGKTRGFSNRYKPDLKFTMELHNCSIKGEIEQYVYRYFDEKQWDRTDKDYNIESLIRLSHRSELTLSASYTIDSNPEQFFTTEQGVQGGVLVQNFPIETKFYSAGYKYNLSPKNSLQFKFGYSTFTSLYSSGSDIYTYSLTEDFILNKKNTIKLMVGYNSLKFSYPSLDPSNPNSFFNYKLDTYTINGGLIHQFDESFKLNFTVGWRYSETKYNKAIFTTDPNTGEIIITGTEPATSNSAGSNFLFLLDKKYYHTTFQFKSQENLFTDPQTGQTYPSLQTGFSVKYDFTNKLYGSVSSYYYRNKASAGDFNNRTTYDRTAYYSTLMIGYIYNKNLSMILGYTNAISKNNNTGTSNDKTIRNNIYLLFSFTLQRPFIVG